MVVPHMAIESVCKTKWLGLGRHQGIFPPVRSSHPSPVQDGSLLSTSTALSFLRNSQLGCQHPVHEAQELPQRAQPPQSAEGVAEEVGLLLRAEGKDRRMAGHYRA